MAEIICIIGTKGGTGKTSLSHMLCHGLALQGRRAACIMTDEYRETLMPDGRGYVVADARAPMAREHVVKKLKEMTGWIGVLDGGANRTENDIALYELSDLVLLPFRDSPEDIRTVLHDLELFPRALALPSQWPTNTWQRKASDALLEEKIPAMYRERILPPVPAIASSRILLHKERPTQVPKQLNQACRAFAQRVLEMIEDDTEDVIAAIGQARQLPQVA